MSTVAAEASQPTLLAHGLREPLLPNQPQRISAWRRLANSCTASVRGGWMSMCGHPFDARTGTWTDGGQPRPEGALSGSTDIHSSTLDAPCYTVD